MLGAGSFRGLLIVAVVLFVFGWLFLRSPEMPQCPPPPVNAWPCK
jgi:hypothetical protein